MSSDLSLSCQYHVTSPVKLSGLVTQSHPSSYTIEKDLSHHCTVLDLAMIVSHVKYIYIYIYCKHGWMVKTRFLYYISCHSIYDIRWMIWSFLIATNTWALTTLWMTTMHIYIDLVIHLLIQTHQQHWRICFKSGCQRWRKLFNSS